MKTTLRSPDDLIRAGLAEETRREVLTQVAARYAIAVSPELYDLMDRSDPADPIARQFVPQPEELQSTAEERADPIGDDAHSPVKGIVHRYPDRILLKAVHVCPVYCRFCFRREMVGPNGDGSLTDAELDIALAYIAEHEEIWEVILTGGDPLILSDRRLARIMDALAGMSHVRIVRLHSRIPVATPELIDDILIEALKRSKKTTYIAVHVNHPRELSPAMRMACARLSGAGFLLLSQTVLLRGVNDDAAILADLMRGFVELGIRPYYLHHPDLAPGTSHFRLSIPEGRKIIGQLRGRISGLCQPAYVLDIPGGSGKVPLTPNYVDDSDPGQLKVRDYKGKWHDYPPKLPQDDEDTGQ